MRSATWRGLLSALPVILALAFLLAPPPSRPRAAVDCRQRTSGPAERTICTDLELAGLDQVLVERIARLERRLSLGQYLALRQWDRAWSQQRRRCGGDRACLMEGYRRQLRDVNRLQLCLNSATRRGTCVRRVILAPDAPSPHAD
ncbi:MAG TPA: hypothetical protein VG900_15065 [Hyphomicrobiaceae bacterium]|jgi:uncharacterized protein|nr:hypothetical protein [Hyphomicrobiaceae bacterium]